MTWRFRIAENCSGPISEMAPQVAILKIFKPHLMVNQIEPKLGERHLGDMEIQNC